MCPSLLTDTITKRPAIRIRCGKPARRTAGAGLLYALVALALLICPGAAQVAADGSPQSSGLTRPCAPVAPDKVSSWATRARRPSRPVQAEPGPHIAPRADRALPAPRQGQSSRWWPPADTKSTPRPVREVQPFDAPSDPWWARDMPRARQAREPARGRRDPETNRPGLLIPMVPGVLFRS